MARPEENLKPNLGKALLGIWGLCVFATSAFLLPDFTRAASGDGFAGVAILIPAIQEEETEEAPAETPEAETPADEPAEEEPGRSQSPGSSATPHAWPLSPPSISQPR